MQIRDLSNPVTSKRLNESLAKRFGYNINLEQFSDVQLEDARNKLRTKMSQFEVTESYDTMLENPTYQKTRMFLEVVNQEILEREMTAGDKSSETQLKNKYDKSGMKSSMKKQYGDKKGKSAYFATIRKKAMSHSVPESWITSAINRMQLGESDFAELSSELTLRYDLSESQASFILAESEEDKAEIIMATKDMVDRITGWLEDVATMKAEQLLELLDSIREQLGSDVGAQYEQTVKPALESIYDALESGRASLTAALAITSGDVAPSMGVQTPVMPDTAGNSEVPAMPEELPELPPIVAGDRAKRESVDYSRRLGMILSSKKK